MRVAVVDPPSYTLPYDHALAAGLARRGHSVDLLAARFPFAPVTAGDGFRRHEVFFALSGRLLRSAPRSRVRFLAKGLEYGPSVWRLLRRLDRLDPEVVHVQWLAMPRLDVRWLRVVARTRATVFTAHDVLPRRTEARIDLWREVFTTADRTIVHSERARERLAELGIERDRIVSIPHPMLGPRDDGPAPPPEGATLLFFGLVRHSKGLDLLLRALPAVARDIPSVRLVVAGDAVEPVEPLRRLAAEVGVADRVEWRLRYIREDEIPALMAEATAVVLPYRRIESSGVLATALGHGRPAVVAEVGSLGETVRAFDAGLAVPPEDVTALASACARLLADRELLERSYRGTAAARAALTWEEAARAHERVYGEVLASRRRS